jgi:pimeloyl-ACP methyl ester carboxylesterase
METTMLGRLATHAVAAAGDAGEAVARRGTVLGSDGAVVPYHVAVPDSAADAKALFVVKGGMGMKVDDLDILGSALADHGIVTYAMPSRSERVASHMVHAEDFDSLLAKAREDFPDLPVVVGGESFGADAMLAWKQLHPEVPGVAMPISALTRPSFTGPIDQLRIAASLVSERARNVRIGLPQAKDIDMTNNPASSVYGLRDPQASLPADLFADGLRLLASAARRTPKDAEVAPTRVLLAGDDKLVFNGATRLYRHLLPNSTIETVEGAGHVLTQETNVPGFVERLAAHVREDAVTLPAQ